MKLKSLIAVTLIFVLGAGLSFAQPPSGTMPPMDPQGKGPHPWMMGDDCEMPMRGVGKFLDLTEAQKSQLDKLNLAHKREMMEMKSESAGYEEKVKLAITSDNFKQKDVDKLVDQISEARAKHIKARIKHMRSVRAILTPEQQVKFDSHVLSGKRGGPGMGHDMHGGRGMGQKGPHGKKGRGGW